MSISTGVEGDYSINCYQALEIGIASQNALTGKDFGSVKFQRKNKVLSFRSLHSSVKLNDETITVDPLLLFQRICLNIKSKDNIQKYFKYELAPFPLSLFEEGIMRKTRKSTFYESFDSIKTIPSLKPILHVVDGGFLLHKVIWYQNETVENIYIHKTKHEKEK